MKILSLNLHCFQEENRIAKLDKIINFIKENDVDVCMFQEVCQQHSATLLEGKIKVGNSAKYISNKLDYNIFYHPVKIGFEIYDEGLAIISKLPIKNQSYKTISNTKDYNTWLKRDLIWCKIDNITFFNTHVGWDMGDESGMKQLDKIIDEIKRHEERYFIAGDFNYPDNSDEIKYFKKYVYSLSDLANVISSENPTFHFNLDNGMGSNNRMIDFIFTNNLCDIKQFEIVFDKPNEYVSDHSGILVEI